MRNSITLHELVSIRNSEIWSSSIAQNCKGTWRVGTFLLSCAFTIYCYEIIMRFMIGEEYTSIQYAPCTTNSTQGPCYLYLRTSRRHSSFCWPLNPTTIFGGPPINYADSKKRNQEHDVWSTDDNRTIYERPNDRDKPAGQTGRCEQARAIRRKRSPAVSFRAVAT